MQAHKSLTTPPVATAVIALLWLVASPRPAHAGGYAAARFGGLRGTVADTNPTAVYYNPGAIGFEGGHALMADLTLALRKSSYRRDADAIDQATLDALDQAGLRDEGVAALTGTTHLTNVVASPFIGASSDLGLDGPLRVGAAFFVPFGGQSTWDETTPSGTFPGAQDGSARWYNIDGVIRSLALGTAVAYRLKSPRLSVGVGLTTYFSEVDSLRARNPDGGDRLVFGDGSLAEGRSLLQVSGIDLGVGAGLLWEALPEQLWIGGSYQSQPGFGTMELQGTLKNTFATAAPAPAADVRFTQALPDIFRLGARYRPQPAIELRLVGDYTRWSHLDQMCLATAGVGDMASACATRADGSLVDDSHGGDVVQIFRRNWQDTYGVRVGAMYFLGDRAEVGVSVDYDSNAIPDATLDAALFDMDKMLFSLGGAYALTDGVSLSMTLTEVTYFTRDTGGVAGNESLALPSRQPGNQGVYAQNILLLNTGLQVHL